MSAGNGPGIVRPVVAAEYMLNKSSLRGQAVGWFS